MYINNTGIYISVIVINATEFNFLYTLMEYDGNFNS